MTVENREQRGKMKEIAAVGAGNIEFNNVQFSLIGLPAPDRRKITETIRDNGGTVAEYSEETRYIICDEDKLTHHEKVSEIRKRESEGSVYIMTVLLFQLWTEPSRDITRLSMERRVATADHFVTHEADWKNEKFEASAKIKSFMTDKVPEILLYMISHELSGHLDRYIKWIRANEMEKWEKNLRFARFNVYIRTYLAVYYLKNQAEWDSVPSGTADIIREFLTKNTVRITDILYRESSNEGIKLYLNWLMFREQQWKDTGYSDGFHTFNVVKRLIERAIKENETDKKSFYLNYKSEHFSEAFAMESEDNDMDIDFGLKERPAAYYGAGEEIVLGRYKVSEADIEPLKWVVLSSDGEKALIICKDAVAAMPYADEIIPSDWEHSPIRTWLNSTFYENTFNGSEKLRIINTTVSNNKNPKFKTSCGHDTADNIFLLSLEEAETYFDETEDRAAAATECAKSQGAFVLGGYTSWWLRTSGRDNTRVAYVVTDGTINEYGCFVNNKTNAVRPAMWIKIETSDC